MVAFLIQCPFSATGGRAPVQFSLIRALLFRLLSEIMDSKTKNNHETGRIPLFAALPDFSDKFESWR